MMFSVRSVLVALSAALTVSAFGESQLIVRLAPGSSAALVGASANVILRDVTVGAPFALYGVPAGTSIEAAQSALLGVPGVVWADDNVVTVLPEQGGKGGSMAVIGSRSDLIVQNSVNLGLINWNANLAASSGVATKIAILDTGLSRRKTDLWSKVDAWMDVFGGVADDSAPTGRGGASEGAAGHGTMIAGICDMVAPQVHLVIAKVAGSDGLASAWNLTKGLAFAATNGVKVANVSLGSVDRVVALRDIADWCDEVGLLFVAAIGNNGAPDGLYPAVYAKALCVSAVNPDGTKASFSNWDNACDMAAPGVGIVSQFWNKQLGSWSGTSFAAPFIAATAAEYLRHRPATNIQDLARVLIESGVSIDGLNPFYKKRVGVLLDYAHVIGPVVP